PAAKGDGYVSCPASFQYARIARVVSPSRVKRTLPLPVRQPIRRSAPAGERAGTEGGGVEDSPSPAWQRAQPFSRTRAAPAAWRSAAPSRRITRATSSALTGSPAGPAAPGFDQVRR